MPIDAEPQIRITTKLGAQTDTSFDNPFIISTAQCTEGISKPYFIDVVLISPTAITIDKFEMLNTVASVFFRSEFKGDKFYIRRKGVFESFGRDQRLRREGAPNLKTFYGRIVPACKLMDQEVIFRTFQRMTVLDIINRCFAKFNARDLSHYLDTSKVDASQFPVLEYCVQFGESTLNFVSRLMAASGISYFFDHERDGELETMVLRNGPIAASDFKRCINSNNDVFFIEKTATLAKFNRQYSFPSNIVSIGAFNQVVPTRPIQSGDVSLSGIKPESSFRGETFPYPFLTNNQSARTFAETNREISEANASMIKAISKNATFGAGKIFQTTDVTIEDRDKNGAFLITDVSAHAYERGFLSALGPDLFTLFVDDLVPAPVRAFAGESIDSANPDLASAMAAAGLNNYTKAWLQGAGPGGSGAPPVKSGHTNVVASVDFNHGTTTSTSVTSTSGVNPGAYFFAGAVAYLTALISPNTTVFQHVLNVIADILEIFVEILKFIGILIALPILAIFALVLLIQGKNPTAFIDDVTKKMNKSTNDIKEAIDKFFKPKAADYSNSVVAIPLNEDVVKINLRLPGGVKPIAHGPHLATVVGDIGVSQSNGDISADALGRVRVRFPWDRHVAPANPNSGDQDAPQFGTSDNTCWPRVSQGWAGQGFGAQFLPRIGDEVIVEFLDGDPDQPIITGRVYNARGTNHPNLPFPGDRKVPAPVNKPDDLVNLFTTKTAEFNRSGIKTRSVPSTDEKGAPLDEGFHLLRFDDSRGSEQYLMRSQWRMDVTTLGSYYDTTHWFRHLTIGHYDTKTNKCWGDYRIKVFNDHDLHVGDARDPASGSLHALFEGNYELRVKKSTELALDGGCHISVGDKGVFTVHAGTIVLDAKTNITLSVGGSSIVITPGMVFISPPNTLSVPGPAVPAIPAGVHEPHPPFPADPGESLQPPSDPPS